MIEGWLTPAQGERLRTASAGRVVEIGSFRGRSTVQLARGDADEIIAIDPYLGSDRGPQEIAAHAARGDADFEAFHRNLRDHGVADRVRHVRKRSADALGDVDGSIDVLFVDGAHRYSLALGDLRDWGARVRPGGTMLVHDTFGSVGVTLAVLRGVLSDRGWRYRGRVGSLAEFRREPRTAVSVLRALASLPWLARNITVKVLILAGLRKGPWPH
jgi:predicted O-methyltransferase YrrM